MAEAPHRPADQSGSPDGPWSDRTPQAGPLLAGIDGCHGGWVVAMSDPTSTWLDFACVPSGGLSPLFDLAAEGRAIVAIDMPIGLWSAGDRDCDRAARRRLGRVRASSVFPPPARETVEAQPASYAEACRINRAATGGRAISRQAMHILPKIWEIDCAFTDSRIAAGIQDRVREVHPEIVFAVLAGTEGGLPAPKRRSEGHRQRLDLLRQHLPPFDPVQVARQLGPRTAQADDVIDAAACLVAAGRIWRGEALVLPNGAPVLDARGLRMEIVA